MQVSHTTDHVTNIAVGKGKVEAFGIAQSAEFFRVLSKSLYTNEMLAVVREILCNAWDAHIAAGCTDTPIQVTLTNDALIIRDFGTGIAPERMKDNYCTYGGGSTKTHDGKQTGGFSLGSKAPFAYTEHFEVTTFHKGTKTLYHLSLSSPDADGLPGIQPIISLPTSETGLQVEIPLKDHKHQPTFKTYIENVVALGEMNVEMNGNAFKTVPFSKAKDGFLSFNPYFFGLSSGLYVRYGSVVYPVPDQGEISAEVSRLSGLFKKAGNSRNYTWGNQAVVLLAPPHSIAVTPSREALSMSETTIATLKDLINTLVKKIEKELKANHDRLYIEALKAQVQKPNVSALFKASFKTFDYAGFNQHSGGFGSVAKLTKAISYYAFQNETPHAIKLRLKTLAENGYDCRGLVRNLIKAVRHTMAAKTYGFEASDNWFKDNLVRPILKKLSQEKDLPARNLLRYTYSSYHGSKFDKLASDIPAVNLGDCIPLSRGIVILSYNRSGVFDRWQHFPLLKDQFGDPDNSLVYIVPRKADAADKARALFTKLGFRVVDMTVRAPTERSDVVIEKAKPVYRPKRNGFVTLNALREEANTPRLNYEKLKEADLPTIQKPSFVVRVTPGFLAEKASRLPCCNHDASAKVISLFGDQGVIVQTIAEEERAIKAGAVSLKDFIFKQCFTAIKKDRKLRSYLSVLKASEDAKKNLYHYDLSRLWRYLCNDPEFSKKYKLRPDVTKEQLNLASLFDEFLSEEQKAELIVADQRVMDFSNKLRNLPKIAAISWNVFRYKDNPEAARDIINFVLKG